MLNRPENKEGGGNANLVVSDRGHEHVLTLTVMVD